MFCFNCCSAIILLIAPEGIEISAYARKHCYQDALLIAPEGIEITRL